MCAIETAKEFIAAGTAPDFLYGMCEGMWQPDMVRDCRSRKAFPHSTPGKCICTTGVFAWS